METNFKQKRHPRERRDLMIMKAFLNNGIISLIIIFNCLNDPPEADSRSQQEMTDKKSRARV